MVASDKIHAFGKRPQYRRLDVTQFLVPDGNKGKGHPITGHEGPQGEWSYSSTLSFILSLYGMDGQRHAPAALQ